MHFDKVCPLLFLADQVLYVPEIIQSFSGLKPGSDFLQAFLLVVLLKLLQHLDLIIQFPVFDGKVSQVGQVYP